MYNFIIVYILYYYPHYIYIEPAYFQQFSVVICSNASPSTIIHLSELCNTYNVPLISLRAVGFIGYCRIQARKHEIIESHPDNELLDLRLSSSFPSLEVCYMRLCHSITSFTGSD